jgi:DNA-binding NarL/FixJ family response regulator
MLDFRLTIAGSAVQSLQPNPEEGVTLVGEITVLLAAIKRGDANAETRPAEWSPRQARLVETMYFGGLTEKEAAEALRVSVRTVKRDWSAARAWLQSQLSTPPA